MRTLTMSAFITLDGVVQAPGGPGEDDEGGFPFGGWTVPYFDDHLGHVMGAFMSEPFDLVLGRKTYDIFAAYWPQAPEEEGAKPLNEATKHVASRGRPTLDWAGSHLIEGDVAEAVAALKQQDDSLGPKALVLVVGESYRGVQPVTVGPAEGQPPAPEPAEGQPPAPAPAPEPAAPCIV